MTKAEGDKTFFVADLTQDDATTITKSITSPSTEAQPLLNRLVEMGILTTAESNTALSERKKAELENKAAVHEACWNLGIKVRDKLNMAITSEGLDQDDSGNPIVLKLSNALDNLVDNLIGTAYKGSVGIGMDGDIA